MIRALTAVGTILSMSILYAIWAFLISVRVTWRCGLCGKLNETGVFKFLLAMCDHTGDYQ